MTPSLTREQAIERATDIVNGRWSCHNMMLQAEADTDHRPQTLAAIAQADAADVVALCALAPLLPSAA